MRHAPLNPNNKSSPNSVGSHLINHIFSRNHAESAKNKPCQPCKQRPFLGALPPASSRPGHQPPSAPGPLAEAHEVPCLRGIEGATSLEGDQPRIHDLPLWRCFMAHHGSDVLREAPQVPRFPRKTHFPTSSRKIEMLKLVKNKTS